MTHKSKSALDIRKIIEGSSFFRLSVPAQRNISRLLESAKIDDEVGGVSEELFHPIPRAVLCTRGLEDISRCYAEISGRRLVVLDDIKDIVNVADAAILIIGQKDWNPHLPPLLRNFERKTGRALGIFPADLKKDHTFALMKLQSSTRTKWSGPPTVSWINGFNGFSRKFASFASFDQFSPFSDVRQGLLDFYDIKIIEGHGDGFDLSIPNGVVCYRSEAPLSPDPGQIFPLCARTGFCHRLECRIEDVFETGKAISAQAIPCRFLVLATCDAWRMLPEDLEETPTIMSSLVYESGASCILAPFGVSFSSLSKVGYLIRRIISSASIGEAVAEANATDLFQQHGWQILIFGDSEAACPNLKAGSDVDGGVGQRSKTRRRVTPSAGGHLRYLKDVLEVISDRVDRQNGDLKIMNPQRIAALRELIGNAGALDDEVLRREADHMLCKLIGSVEFQIGWLSLPGWRSIEQEGALCPQCRGPCLVVAGGSAGQWTRISHSCPECGWSCERSMGDDGITFGLRKNPEMHTILDLNLLQHGDHLLVLKIFRHHLSEDIWSCILSRSVVKRSIDLSKIVRRKFGAGANQRECLCVSVTCVKDLSFSIASRENVVIMSS